MTITRREFLKSSAAGITISVLSPTSFASAFDTATASHDRILVILQLAGGNDAINTFVPYTDPKYRSLRPALALPDAQILKVDSRIGFHPSMAKLQPLYQQGKFSFVNNVGFPGLDRSHFHCQDVWQTGDDTSSHAAHAPLGWVGRYADLYLGHDSSLTSVAIGTKVPLGMSAEHTGTAVVENAAAFDVQTDDRYPNDRTPLVTTLRSIYGTEAQHGGTGTIRHVGASMFSSIDLLKTIAPPSTTAAYPDTALGRGMKLVAQMAGSQVGTRVVWVTTGGFDTHSGQLDDHARLWTDVSDSLAAFQQDIEERHVADRVLLVGWSEFGRRVQENASAGTDHGKAGTVLLLGSMLRGGSFYGEIPDLSRLDNGDLPTQIDFRSVYATIIRDFLGNDPEPVLNGRYENLGFIRSAAMPRRRSARG